MLQIFPKESSVRTDQAVSLLVEHLLEKQGELDLTDGVLFYNFPLFREDERLLVADLALISPWHGVLLLAAPVSIDDNAIAQLDGAFNQVFSRLVRYPRLRQGRAQLKFQIDARIWLPEGERSEDVIVGFSGLNAKIKDMKQNSAMDGEVFEELVSVLDGSKALLKPKERATEGFPSDSRVAIISRVEEEIRRFDRDQRVAYMTEIGGLQRIQGLAGSGKTVVLALKAALTAVREPHARIAVTFYTKSLYQHIKQLITRFYRMHEDRDPDWNRIHVLHAWGGATVEGLYYVTARRFGHEPINFAQAKALSRRQPFAAVCSRLLEDPQVASTYDYVFVDEAQDFPPEFMKLALRLAVDEKLVIAYDVFQTIFDVEVPTAEVLFGAGEDGDSAAVEFDEDIVLHKCYRNPREILVCAHAIGFGLYGSRIVQMLESREHWEDFGYEVKGELVSGQEVEVVRPEENSPSSISESNSIGQIISCQVFETLDQELEFVVSRIIEDIRSDGVPPEDVLVIVADDRNANLYLNEIGKMLSAESVRTNNIHGGAFGVPDFQQEGAVTLSTVYKAKGNEAYSVYLLGVDSLFERPTPRSRNIAFTAMTRAKGWLCVTGMGPPARAFRNELSLAKKYFPSLRFIYPSQEDLVFMKRDLRLAEPSEVDEEISRLAHDLDPAEFERILRRRLREVQSLQRAKRRSKR